MRDADTGTGIHERATDLRKILSVEAGDTGVGSSRDRARDSRGARRDDRCSKRSGAGLSVFLFFAGVVGCRQGQLAPENSDKYHDEESGIPACSERLGNVTGGGSWSKYMSPVLPRGQRHWPIHPLTRVLPMKYPRSPARRSCLPVA